MITDRLAALRATLAAEKWDAFIVSQPENRRYLSGFTGSAGLLLITPSRALLLTDFRYTEQAGQQAPDFEVVRIANGLSAHLSALLGELHLTTVAFESAHVTVAEHRRWSEGVASVSWVSAENVVESLRMVKEPEEIAAIRRAVKLADKAFQHLLRKIRPAMTERQVVWQLESYMRTRGAEKVAFDLIVGSGPNGAMPHATASERELRPGEPIVIDMGALLDGYHSDMTRTICLGEADAQFMERYELVLRAQQAAEGAIKPGLTGREVDEVARTIIEEAGLGACFGHGLGHGVGLAIHEGPRLSQMSTETLRPGMVVTVEPGVYLPGWGGVRIEDMVVVTEKGCKVLTQASKDPLAHLPSH